MSLWNSITAQAKKVGSAAGTAAQKTQLRTELLMIDRELKARQRTFGVQLYDYVSPLSKHADFFAADDMLTTTLRPPLLTAQREIAALEIKRTKLREEQAQAEVKRKAAFPVPAQNWQEKLKNAGKSTAMAGSEAKLKTEASVLETKIKSHKQTFGTDLYPVLENLEDTKQWLPTDREIRSMYDTCRKDMEKIKKRKAAKQAELAKLGGPSLEERQSLGDSMHENESAVQDSYASPTPPSHSPPPPAAQTLPPSSSDPFAVPLSAASNSPHRAQTDPFAPSPGMPTTMPSSSSDPFASMGGAPMGGMPSQPPPTPPNQPPPPPPGNSSGGQQDLLW